MTAWDSVEADQTKKTPTNLLYFEEVLSEIQSSQFTQDPSRRILSIKNTSTEFLHLFWKFTDWASCHPSWKRSELQNHESQNEDKHQGDCL